MSGGPTPLTILVDRQGSLSSESPVPVVAEALKQATVTPTGGTPAQVTSILVPLDPSAPGFQSAISALLAAFETSLPSSDAGLPVGAWWSNGGIPTRVKVAS